MHSRLARQLIVASLAPLHRGVYAGTGAAAKTDVPDAPYSPAIDDGSRI